MENGRLTAAISLIVGMVIGINWPKIKKAVPEVKKKTMELAEATKETIMDTTMKLSKMIVPAKNKAVEMAKSAEKAVEKKVSSATAMLMGSEDDTKRGRPKKVKLAKA